MRDVAGDIAEAEFTCVQRLQTGDGGYRVGGRCWVSGEQICQAANFNFRLDVFARVLCALCRSEREGEQCRRYGPMGWFPAITEVE